jgi:hypothetical protein
MDASGDTIARAQPCLAAQKLLLPSVVESRTQAQVSG